MNIAFPAFFILILILPGFIFQNAYEKVERTNIEKKPFDVSSSLAFFYALLIHSTLCFILVPITGNEVDYKLCIQLLTGSKNLPVAELTSISDNVPKILAYFSTALRQRKLVLTWSTLHNHARYADCSPFPGDL